MKNIPYSHTRYAVLYLTKDKSPVSEEHKEKNEDKIGEFHKSQLKF